MRRSCNADQYLRYHPVLELIERSRPLEILDVGCGSWGIGAFMDQPFTGCDVAFTEPVCPWMRVVRASIETLPFADRSFDLVICSDVLEHVPPEARQRGIAELLRVTRGDLWLACPTGRTARSTDESIAVWLGRRGKEQPPWLREHLALAYPERESIATMLGAAAGRLTIHGLENWWIHRLIARADLTRIGVVALRLVPRGIWCLVARRGNLQPVYRTAFHFRRL